jgi:hypothetical protein
MSRETLRLDQGFSKVVVTAKRKVGRASLPAGRNVNEAGRDARPTDF